MHACASALTAVRRIHANAAYLMLRRAADNSSKALKEGHAKESKLEKTIMNSLSWVIGGAQGSGLIRYGRGAAAGRRTLRVL